LNICCIGPSGEDDINSKPCAATIESAVRLCRSFIYNCSTKALIAVAVEEDGRGIGRIRMRCILDASAASLMLFVEESIEPGSVVRTDDGQGYQQLKSKGYQHEVTYLKGNSKFASELMPRVNLAIALLKRWLLGTHQGGVSLEHMDA
jgi:hypothetical protein